MYLFNLGWVLVLLPAAMEDDFGLGCAAGPHHRRGEDGRIWHFAKSETKSEYEYEASPGSGSPKECQVLVAAPTVHGRLYHTTDNRRHFPALHVVLLPEIDAGRAAVLVGLLRAMPENTRTATERPEGVPRGRRQALSRSIKAGVKSLVERMKNPPAKITPVEAPIDCEEAPAPGAAPRSSRTKTLY